MSRIHTIDALRGLALAAILVDHIPGSWLASLTPRNFALFDATELFVFLSGLSVALAWQAAERRGEHCRLAARLVRRSVKIWAAYVATAVALSLIAASLSAMGLEYRAIWSGYGAAIIGEPIDQVIRIAAGLSQPNIADVLVMYIPLIAFAPTVAYGASRYPAMTVVVSALIWFAAAPLGAALPGNAGEGPLFNPFAWQVLFVAGAMCRFHGKCISERIEADRILLAAVTAVATALLLFGLVLRIPALSTALHVPFAPSDFPKWEVHPVRIMSFVAAVWLFRTLGIGELRAVWNGPAGRALASIGRAGLTCFCIGALMSLGSDAAARSLGGGVANAVFDLLAVALLYGVSRAAARFTSDGGRGVGSTAHFVSTDRSIEIRRPTIGVSLPK